MTTITHKRGDTFELSATLENEGNPVDITNLSLASQMRDSSDILLQALTVTKTDSPNGVFTLTATSTQTESWGVEQYQCDIEITDAGGEVNSSETFAINVVKDITRNV